MNKVELEMMGFKDEPWGKQHSIDDIQVFFGKRLRPNSEKVGIKVGTDFLGNRVYTSLGTSEQTFAGFSPSSLVVSGEGRSLVACNHGLLKQIANGEVEHTGPVFEGFEGYIYRLSLLSDEGKKDFALKYSFPVSSDDFADDGSYINTFTHTSGIIAMRIMQLAEIERPVNCRYAIPLLATHDITLTPFINDGVNTDELMRFLRGGVSSYGFEMDYGLDEHKIDLLDEMYDYEMNHQNDHSFFQELSKLYKVSDDALKEWVANKVATNGELQSFRYSSNDTGLGQSVISVEDLYRLFKRFKQEVEFNGDNPEFETAFLQTITLVELGRGYITTPA